MLTNTGPHCWSGVLLREGVREGSHAVHESEAVPGAVTQAHCCRILAYLPCRAGSLNPSRIEQMPGPWCGRPALTACEGDIDKALCAGACLCPHRRLKLESGTLSMMLSLISQALGTLTWKD